jgi:hypothetical protein
MGFRVIICCFQIITGMIPDAVGKKLIGLVTSKDEIADLLTVRMQFEYSYDDCANKNVKNSVRRGIIVPTVLY